MGGPVKLSGFLRNSLAAYASGLSNQARGAEHRADRSGIGEQNAADLRVIGKLLRQAAAIFDEELRRLEREAM